MRLSQKCIKPMTIFFFIYDLWPEFSELLAMRPIMINEFHSTETNFLNKTFFDLVKIYNFMS